jgi:hypothetical protein
MGSAALIRTGSDVYVIRRADATTNVGMDLKVHAELRGDASGTSKNVRLTIAKLR